MLPEEWTGNKNLPQFEIMNKTIKISMNSKKVLIYGLPIRILASGGTGGYFGVMVPAVSVKQCHFKRYCNYI
ncbi:hypothetical protein [Leeuwenhoekiella polynyae]|uniref:hypothetical protein n=1 Tax=Leeuwenhoekiella polynyae TaxID=1550906 RepID=UPI000FFF672C|nr:hypothetical protein [Leeuwenhoekiella polynyae]